MEVGPERNKRKVVERVGRRDLDGQFLHDGGLSWGAPSCQDQMKLGILEKNYFHIIIDSTMEHRPAILGLS